MEFEIAMFLILFVMNIILIIKQVPIFGFMLGFLTIVLDGAVFMQDTVTFNLAFNIVLFGIAFASVMINGLELVGKRKKK